MTSLSRPRSPRAPCLPFPDSPPLGLFTHPLHAALPLPHMHAHAHRRTRTRTRSSPATWKLNVAQGKEHRRVWVFILSLAFIPGTKLIIFPPLENGGSRIGVLKFNDSKTKDSYPKGISERPFQERLSIWTIHSYFLILIYGEISFTKENTLMYD